LFIDGFEVSTQDLWVSNRDRTIEIKISWLRRHKNNYIPKSRDKLTKTKNKNQPPRGRRWDEGQNPSKHQGRGPCKEPIEGK
jgi:hypothetical protein